MRPPTAQCSSTQTRPGRPRSRCRSRVAVLRAPRSAFGNGDAHAKNYSFLLAGDRAVLAPIYDTVPTILYPHYNGDFSMPIGNARRPDDVNERNWRRFAEDAGLDPDMVCEEAFAITGKVADRYEDLFGRAGLDPSRMKTIQKHVRVLRRGLPTATASAAPTDLIAPSGNPHNSVRSTTRRRAATSAVAPPRAEARANAEGTAPTTAEQRVPARR